MSEELEKAEAKVTYCKLILKQFRDDVLRAQRDLSDAEYEVSVLKRKRES